MTDQNRRGFVRASGAAALATLGLAGRAGAQGTQPLETVRIVTGFPPGGTSDTLCRRVAEGLRGTAYTKAALVENKAGAGGQIAVQSMKGAATDGSVILQTPASMLMIYPHIYKKPGLQRLHRRDAGDARLHLRFRLLRRPGRARQREEHPGVPRPGAKPIPTRPTTARRPSGSVPHFIGVLLGQAGGIELKHVAYRGTAARRAGHGRRPDPGRVRPGRRVHPAGHRRQGALPRRLGRHRAAASRPTCRPSPSRATRTWSSRNGSASSRRAARRRRWCNRANEALRTALAQKDVIDGLAVMGLEVKSSTPQELARAPEGELRPLGADREEDRLHGRLYR